MASAEAEIVVHEMPSFGLYVSINITQVSFLFCSYSVSSVSFLFLKFHHVPAHTEIVTGRFSGISASLLPLHHMFLCFAS